MRFTVPHPMKPPRPHASVSRRRFLGQLSAAAAFIVAPREARALEAPASSKKLGVALLGLGSYSTNQLGPALRKTEHCQLTGVITGDHKKGKRWAREYGFPEKNIFSYDTIAQIAGNPDIDIVYVVTPNGVHAGHVIAAAKAGKHVICEKPMANTVADCDAMIAACRDAGVRLMVGYRLHYEPHTAELVRLAREKTFGPFMRIKGENGFSIDPDARPGNMWRLDKKLAGGGPLMDMGVYVVQAVCMAKVEAAPIAVTAKFGPVTMPEVFSEVEESIEWTMEYADGAKADCVATYAGQLSTFRAEADGGWAELVYPAFYYDEPILKTSRGTPHFPKVNHQVAQMDAMALELLSGRPSIAPGEMGRRDVAIVEAIYAAARSGQRVEVRA
jgi:glucose-fructose oxidoreductase